MVRLVDSPSRSSRYWCHRWKQSSLGAQLPWLSPQRNKQVKKTPPETETYGFSACGGGKRCTVARTTKAVPVQPTLSREWNVYGGLPSAGRGGSARDHACASVDRWMADLAVCGPQMVVGRFVYLYVLWVETICIPRAKGCGPPAGRI